jgi:hypothetical protein
MISCPTFSSWSHNSGITQSFHFCHGWKLNFFTVISSGEDVASSMSGSSKIFRIVHRIRDRKKPNHAKQNNI